MKTFRDSGSCSAVPRRSRPLPSPSIPSAGDLPVNPAAGGPAVPPTGGERDGRVRGHLGGGHAEDGGYSLSPWPGTTPTVLRRDRRVVVSDMAAELDPEFGGRDHGGRLLRRALSRISFTPARPSRPAGTTQGGTSDGAEAPVTHSFAPGFLGRHPRGRRVRGGVARRSSSRLWARVFAPSHCVGVRARVAPAGTDPARGRRRPAGRFVVAWQNGQTRGPAVHAAGGRSAGSASWTPESP